MRPIEKEKKDSMGNQCQECQKMKLQVLETLYSENRILLFSNICSEFTEIVYVVNS